MEWYSRYQDVTWANDDPVRRRLRCMRQLRGSTEDILIPVENNKLVLLTKKH